MQKIITFLIVVLFSITISAQLNPEQKEVKKIIDSNELWLKKIVGTIIERLDSAIDILAEHKIFDTSKNSDFVFSDEIEAKFRKLING